MKKAIYALVAAALAAVLAPAVAFAAAPVDDLTTATDVALQTQAKKTVYVPTKVVQKISNGDGSFKTTMTAKYTYNRNGLLTKRTTKYQSGSGAMAFSYKGKNVTKVSTTSASMKLTYKNGKKASGVFIMGDGSVSEVDETYTVRSGKLAKVKLVRWYKDSSTGAWNSSTGTVTYAYKKGLPVKVTMVNGGPKVVSKYTYDKKGNLTKSKTGVASADKFANTYDKKNLLKKRVVGDGDQVYEYTYKAVSVPSNYASTVKDQSWAIINGMDNALGVALGGWSIH